jgi:hypothetical protein
MRHQAKTTVHNSLKNTRALFLFIWVLISCLCFCPSAHAEGDWALTLYGARLSADTLGEALTFNAHYTDSYLAVLAVSWRAFSFREFVDIEVEGQVGKHFGGGQDNWEINALPVVRWRYFPWNEYLRTSIAAGMGLSDALGTPSVEASGVAHPSRLKGYVMFEVAASLPQWPKWAVVARVHHRSGAGGLISKDSEASNAVGFGIRYVFH